MFFQPFWVISSAAPPGDRKGVPYCAVVTAMAKTSAAGAPTHDYGNFIPGDELFGYDLSALRIPFIILEYRTLTFSL